MARKKKPVIKDIVEETPIVIETVFSDEVSQSMGVEIDWREEYANLENLYLESKDMLRRQQEQYEYMIMELEKANKRNSIKFENLAHECHCIRLRVNTQLDKNPLNRLVSNTAFLKELKEFLVTLINRV